MLNLSCVDLGHEALEREAPRVIFPTRSNSSLRLHLLVLLSVNAGKPRSAIQGRGGEVVVEYTEVRVKKK